MHKTTGWPARKQSGTRLFFSLCGHLYGIQRGTAPRKRLSSLAAALEKHATLGLGILSLAGVDDDSLWR
jgi:hypothetical protein